MVLVSCPSCRCPVKNVESSCPHCSAALRAADGSIGRTAVAVLLGLSSATLGATGCASAPKYGVPATDEPLVQPSASASSTSSRVVQPDLSEPPPMAPEYGVPATSTPAPMEEPPPEDAAIYGIPATPSK